MTTTNGETEIPKTCKAGVVENEGPDFKLVVEDVPTPEPGKTATRSTEMRQSWLTARERSE